VLTFAFAGGGIRMGEFHRKSSAKKECIVGIKEKRQEEKEEEEEEERKRRKKKNGWKREKKRNIYLYKRKQEEMLCPIHSSTVRLKFPLI
jgi:hypothetical protein